MRDIKLVLALFFLVLLTSCSSYTRKDVESRYTKLSANFDTLVSDEINEKKRAKLEKEFQRFSDGIERYEAKNELEDSDYLNEYLKKIDLKIQYLKDLKD